MRDSQRTPVRGQKTRRIGDHRGTQQNAKSKHRRRATDDVAENWGGYLVHLIAHEAVVSGIAASSTHAELQDGWTECTAPTRAGECIAAVAGAWCPAASPATEKRTTQYAAYIV